MSLREREGFKRANTFTALPEHLFIAGVDDDDDDHYLSDVDDIRHGIDEAMVRNIMVNGVIETVIVVEEGDRVIVVAGRRRVLHAREANKRLIAAGEAPHWIEVKAKRGTRSKMFGVFVSENEHRADDSMLGRAEKAERLRDFNTPEDEIQAHFGVSAQTLTNWKKLLELDDRVKDLVRKGQLAPSAALQLHGLNPDEQWEKAQAAIKQAQGSGKRRPSGTTVGGNGAGKVRAPSLKLVTKLVEAGDTSEEGIASVTDDFLRGLQYGRGLLSAEDAGVADVVESLKTKPKKGGKGKGKGAASASGGVPPVKEFKPAKRSGARSTS